MSVPLDRLYHFLADIVNHDLVIYRWAPHGSRKLEDLTPINKYSKVDFLSYPMLLCHDQEPLLYGFYSKNQIKVVAKNVLLNANITPIPHIVLEYHADQYLRGALSCSNQFDLTMLLHSELNSAQVGRHAQNGFVPVYYWAHAIIAHDWFRYAKHDTKLCFDSRSVKKDFLVYNRAWCGTREYRLYFAQQLVLHGLISNTQMSFATMDNETHYVDHVFANKKFQIHLHNLEQVYPANTADSGSSADYCGSDYAACGIEVVLETLFDDTRWHLTEKALRPIACGKPFILAATPGSLQYLQNYGFETFSGLIDESYDLITNSRERLDAVIQEMKRIAGLDTDAKQVLYTKLHEIAQRNKQRFFNGLFGQVIEEYKTNMYQAMIVMQQHCTGHHRVVIKQLLEQN